MELRMNPMHLPEPLSFNYDELKEMLVSKVAAYEAAIYAPEQMTAAKADRAALNRLKKALNDERLKQEQAYMAPFNEFKQQVNDLIRIIDGPVAAIDKQVKAYEERKREEKRQQIEKFFKERDFSAAVKLEQFFNPKWLNASYSMETIKEDITLRMEQARKDLEVIHALPEYAFEAEVVYLSSLDLAKAVSEAHRRSDEAKKKAEWEAEKQRRKAEAEVQQLAPAPVTLAPAEQPAAPRKQWVSFKACMTIDDAKALKAFFQSRGIEFEAI